jgi:hypothetical protein
MRQLVGHDVPQERADALAGLRLVVEDAIELLVHGQPHQLAHEGRGRQHGLHSTLSR